MASAITAGIIVDDLDTGFSLDSWVKMAKDKIQEIIIGRHQIFSDQYRRSFLIDESDTSSVYPLTKTKGEIETVLVDRLIPEPDLDMDPDLEYDVIFSLPPKENYTIKVSISKVTRGEPVIIVPDDL